MTERLVPAAIIALALIVSAFLAGGRYTMAGGDDLIVWRLDRYTGAVAMCGGVGQNGDILACGPLSKGRDLPNSN